VFNENLRKCFSWFLSLLILHYTTAKTLNNNAKIKEFMSSHKIKRKLEMCMWIPSKKSTTTSILL